MPPPRLTGADHHRGRAQSRVPKAPAGTPPTRLGLTIVGRRVPDSGPPPPARSGVFRRMVASPRPSSSTAGRTHPSGPRHVVPVHAGGDGWAPSGPSCRTSPIPPPWPKPNGPGRGRLHCCETGPRPISHAGSPGPAAPSSPETARMSRRGSRVAGGRPDEHRRPGGGQEGRPASTSGRRSCAVVPARADPDLGNPTGRSPWSRRRGRRPPRSPRRHLAGCPESSTHCPAGQQPGRGAGASPSPRRTCLGQAVPGGPWAAVRRPARPGLPPSSKRGHRSP